MRLVQHTSEPDGTVTVECQGLVPGEDREGSMIFKFTHEGLIVDVWCDDRETEHPGSLGENIGTSSETYEEIVHRLVEANA